jgi:hypothetical protein
MQQLRVPLLFDGTVPMYDHRLRESVEDPKCTRGNYFGSPVVRFAFALVDVVQLAPATRFPNTYPHVGFSPCNLFLGQLLGG